MDAGLPIRPVATATQTGVARPESVPVREAAPTELAAAKSVSASEAGRRPHNERAASNLLTNPAVEREVVIDAEAREVIFRTLDVRTGEVKTQVPEQALLRLRAFAKAVANGKTPAEAFADPNRGILA